MPTTLVIRTHLVDGEPAYARIHTWQCPDVQPVTDDASNTHYSSATPGRLVTARDLRNQWMLQSNDLPLTEHACVAAQEVEDAQAVHSPTTADLAADLGVEESGVLDAASAFYRLHGTAAAFYPELRGEQFVLRPACEQYIRSNAAERPDLFPADSVCDACGDHSDSEPGLPCGRSIGPDGEDDDHPDATVCTGTYRIGQRVSG
jgi:hypothetical protein